MFVDIGNHTAHSVLYNIFRFVHLLLEQCALSLARLVHAVILIVSPTALNSLPTPYFRFSTSSFKLIVFVKQKVHFHQKVLFGRITIPFLKSAINLSLCRSLSFGSGFHRSMTNSWFLQSTDHAFSLPPTHHAIPRNGHADLLHPQPQKDIRIEELVLMPRPHSLRLLQIIIKALVQHHRRVRYVHKRFLQLVLARHEIRVHDASPRHDRLKHIEIRAAMEDPAVLRLKKTLFPDRAAAVAEVIARRDAIDEVPVGFEGVERHGELGGVESDGGDEELRFMARSERNAVG